MAAELIAAHGAAMECYRRATSDDHEFGERDENLRHANRLSRTVVALSAALERRRVLRGPRKARAPQDDGRNPLTRHPEERAKPASKGAKQPHPEIPRARAARLEGVRRRKDPVDFDSLSDEQLEAIALLEELVPIIEQGLQPGDLRAVEKAVAEAKAALTKSAKQPSGAPAPAPPPAPAAEFEKQPSAAPAHTETAKQPRAKLTLGEALRTVLGSGGPVDARKANELYFDLAPGDREAFLDAVNARAREQIHGKPPVELR